MSSPSHKGKVNNLTREDAIHTGYWGKGIGLVKKKRCVKILLTSVLNTGLQCVVGARGFSSFDFNLEIKVLIFK